MLRNNLIRDARHAAEQRPKLLERSRTEFAARHTDAEPLFDHMRIVREGVGSRPTAYRIDHGDHTIKRTVSGHNGERSTESLEFVARSSGSVLFTKRGLVIVIRPLDEAMMETLQPEEAANRFLSPHEVGLTSYDEKIGVPVPQGDNFVVRAPFAYFSDPAQALIRRHIVDSIAAVATPAQ